MLENATKNNQKNKTLGLTARFSTVQSGKRIQQPSVCSQCYLPSSQICLQEAFYVIGSVEPNTLFQNLNQHYFCWRLQHGGHTKHSVSEKSLPLWCTPRKSLHRTVTTWGKKHQLKRPGLRCPGAQREAGKNPILKAFLLRHLSTYFSVLSHLEETGYRLCGIVWTSNSSICLSQVKTEVGWFSSSICTFLTLQNRNRNKKPQLHFRKGWEPTSAYQT